ncbi:peptidase inhibitor family I36 protein [Streptomyces sp. NBC_01341]|uniref:peptidase inhibitor family I36 protein n=1 Tax=Streptomyces sp. NBC_01341 TaxID=2903831 RepID=UPI002E136382|nr:peptidase inhibitor family I36 protein [Streptomyces sp. NBC_01341]
MTRFRRIGLTLAAVAALTFTPVLPAQAAPTAYQCDAGRDKDGVLVVFRDRDYGGECRAWSDPRYGDLAWTGMNDDISSLKNRTPYTLCFYSEANNQGAVFQIHAWEWWYNIPSWIDNQISSFDYC